MGNIFLAFISKQPRSFINRVDITMVDIDLNFLYKLWLITECIGKSVLCPQRGVLSALTVGSNYNQNTLILES